MPVFRPRNKVEIMRDMVARVVGRSRLSGLRKNGFVWHVLSSAANEDAEQYFQLARMRDLFDVDNCTGSDLDERAQEIVFDDTLTRVGAVKASAHVKFWRTGTTGTTTIPLGTVVAAADTTGQILFTTTAAGSITPGNTETGLVPILANVAGTRSNVAAGAISRLVSRVTGVVGVVNASAITNGLDREADADWRARLKRHTQSLSRGTPFAVESFAASAALSDGSRVRYAVIVEPVVPNGTSVVYLDDGTGGLDVYNSDFLTSGDTLIASAIGGEERTQTSRYAIRDDGSFVLKKNTVTLLRNVDYFLNRATGEIGFAVALTAADEIVAYYRNYSGLVYEAQLIISGLEADRTTYPGVAPTATEIRALPATRALQTVAGQLSVENDYDVETVKANVISAIQTYINTLSIGELVRVSRIIEKAMAVPGVRDFTLTSPTVNQYVLENQVARVLSAGISVI